MPEHLSAIRSVSCCSLPRLGEGGGIQFDSDYSGGDGASPQESLQVSGIWLGSVGVLDTANLNGEVSRS